VKSPIKAIRVKGDLPEHRHKVISLDEALSAGYITLREAHLYLNIVGERSFLDYMPYEFHGVRSDYYGDFYQGATIVPQSCWFVDVVDASNPNFVVVKSSRRASIRGNVKATIGPLPVEREFIYGVLTSAEVLPFCHLPPNVAVLPIRPSGNSYVLINRSLALTSGFKYLARWLYEAEKVYATARGRKRGPDLYSWLDYQRKLTRQNPQRKYKVFYLRSAKHLAATIARNGPIKIEIAGGTLELRGILMGHTLHGCGVNDVSEAYYLVAILNAPLLDAIIKPMQTRGEFGERDIGKKPLEFPILRFNPENNLHIRLSKLGEESTKRAWTLLPKLMSEYKYDERLRERGCLTPREVGRLRAAIRDELNDLLRQIDDAFRELLGESVPKYKLVEETEKTGLKAYL